jgi:hypothetical protein
VRYPCERYLRLLLAGGTFRLNVQGVVHFLHKHGFPVTDQTATYLYELSDEVEATRPRPYLTCGQPPQGWLDEQGLGLWMVDPAVSQMALLLLQSAEPRELLETLLIAGIDDGDVAAAMTAVLGDIEYSEAVVSVYRTFFWDRRSLRQAEWSRYLDLHPQGEDLYICYVLPPWYARWLTGTMDPNTDYRTGMQEISTASLAMTKKIVSGFSDNNISGPLATYFGIVARTQREIGGATRLDKLLSSLKQLALTRRAMEFPSMKEFSANAEITVSDGRAVPSLPSKATGGDKP